MTPPAHSPYWTLPEQGPHAEPAPCLYDVGEWLELARPKRASRDCYFAGVLIHVFEEAGHARYLTVRDPSTMAERVEPESSWRALALPVL